MKDKLMRKSARGKQGLRSLIALLPSDLVGLEIGSYAGESTKLFLESGKFKKLYCVDFWYKGFYKDRGTGEKTFDNVISIFPNVAVKMKMNCNDIVLHLKNAGVNFVYIDGTHTYEQVMIDINNSLTLLENKGIISGHDYIKDTPGVIKAVNEQFGKPDNIFIDASWIKFL